MRRRVGDTEDFGGDNGGDQNGEAVLRIHKTCIPLRCQ